MRGMDNRYYRRGINLFEVLAFFLPLGGAIIGVANGARLNGFAGGMLGLVAGILAGYAIYFAIILVLAGLMKWLTRNDTGSK
jgi:uncharacterized membrane protein